MGAAAGTALLARPRPADGRRLKQRARRHRRRRPHPGATAQLNGTSSRLGSRPATLQVRPDDGLRHRQSHTVPLGRPTKAVKVGETVDGSPAGLALPDHAPPSRTRPKGPKRLWHDKTYQRWQGASSSSHAKGKEERLPVVYGGTFELRRAALTGNGDALQTVSLQASPYPVHRRVHDAGGTVVTSRTGTFAFPVARGLPEHAVADPHQRPTTATARS